MTPRTLRLPLVLGVALACILQLAPSCSAQQPDPNGLPYTNEEPSGCPRFSALPPLNRAVVESCDKEDSVEVTLPLKPDAKGFAREKRVRGVYEFSEYRIPESEQDYAFDHLMNQLPMAGFIIKYSVKPSMISARNGDTWLLINVSDDSYSVTAVRQPPEVWTFAKTDEEIAREMQAHDRVDIYGIEFLPEDQSILERRPSILLEILKYLEKNPDLRVVIESHKMSREVGPKEDAEITRQRANAVVGWLIAHGVARERLQPKACGRSNPLTENESPSEVQRNERIVLTKPVKDIR